MAQGKSAGYERWTKTFNLKEAAKRAFDALNGKPIPKVAQLSEEYAALLSEKKDAYAQYKELRQKMIDYQTLKQNVDTILGLDEQTRQTERQQQGR